MTQETRHTVTFAYPGVVFPEEGAGIPIPQPTIGAVAAVSPDEYWQAATVRTSIHTLYRSEEGDERWLHTRDVATFRIYVGEEFGADRIEALPDDHSILLANMRSNGWAKVVRTRRGTWQPVEDGDVVLTHVPA